MKNELTQALSEMISDIRYNQAKNNAGFVAETIMLQFQKFPDITLVAIEEILRELKSRIYLIALPISLYGANYDSFYPDKTEIKKGLPFALWVCMNGETEALGTLQKAGSDDVNNIINLFNCGFLTCKEEMFNLN